MRTATWILMALLFLLSAAVMLHGGQRQLTAADISHEHELVFFSAPWCGYCDRARAWFDTQAVDYLEVDIESSTEANRLWREAGGRGVPLVLVGEQRIPGYAPAAYASALRMDPPD